MNYYYALPAHLWTNTSIVIYIEITIYQHTNSLVLIYGKNSPVGCVYDSTKTAFLHALASILTAYHYLTARPKQRIYLSLF